MTVELIHDPDTDGDISECAKSDRDKSGTVVYDNKWSVTYHKTVHTQG